MTRKAALLPAAFMAVLLLSACTTAPYSSSGPNLAGTRWIITSIDGQPPVSDRAEIRFDAERLSATVGCNGMGGTWRMQNGRLMGGPYMSTKMWCEGLMDQEQAIGALLGETPQVEAAGDRLILRGTGHQAELRRAE